jgi:hypothetical protein
MNKKLLIALADTIRNANAAHATNRSPGTVPFTEAGILSLADFCAAANPNFKRSRWLDYINGKCGPNGGKMS